MLFLIQKIANFCIKKTLRENAARAETKMHLHARTGAQRVLSDSLFRLQNQEVFQK